MPTDRKTPNFNHSPMLWLAAAFAVGIALARFGDIDVMLAMAVSLALAVGAVLSSSFSRPSTAGSQLKLELRTVLILAAFAAAGAASFEMETRNIAATRIRALYDNGVIASGDPVEMEGTLNAAPEPTFEGSFLTLRTEAITNRGATQVASGNVRLFVPDFKSEISNFKSQISDLKYGSRIRVACRLEREDEFRNPGVISRKEILDRM